MPSGNLLPETAGDAIRPHTEVQQLGRRGLKEELPLAEEESKSVLTISREELEEILTFSESEAAREWAAIEAAVGGFSDSTDIEEAEEQLWERVLQREAEERGEEDFWTR